MEVNHCLCQYNPHYRPRFLEVQLDHPPLGRLAREHGGRICTCRSRGRRDSSDRGTVIPQRPRIPSPPTTGTSPLQDGWTPLHLSAQEGHTGALGVLLRGGADPNSPTPVGWEGSRVPLYLVLDVFPVTNA